MKSQNTHPLTGQPSPEQWQEAVNNAYADLLISAALDSGFLNGPQIDLAHSWETLMAGLRQSVHPQKEKVIEIIAAGIEPGDPAFSRRFAERLWEELAGRMHVKGH
jgi:hypothetical protein